MAPTIGGPGFLWVQSRITAKDILSEETFLAWYDDKHLPKVVATSGFKSGFRYVNVDNGSPSVGKPFLALYPMEDLAFTLTDEFKDLDVNIEVQHEERIVYDVADFDVLYLETLDEREANSKKELAQYLLVSAIEPANATRPDQISGFYEKQTAALSLSPHYLGTLQFKLQFALTDAQTRAIKGLPTGDETPSPAPPTWHAIHEFSEEPSSDIQECAKNEASDMLEGAKHKEVNVYRLAKALGGRTAL